MIKIENPSTYLATENTLSSVLMTAVILSCGTVIIVVIHVGLEHRRSGRNQDHREIYSNCPLHTDYCTVYFKYGCLNPLQDAEHEKKGEVNEMK